MAFLGEIPLVRRTWAVGSHVAGKFVKGAMTDSGIRGAWRPMTAAQLQILEEGDRRRDPRTLATRTQLQFGEQGTGLVSDHVSPDGGVKFWEVISERDGSAETTFRGPGNHYEYGLLRVQEVDG